MALPKRRHSKTRGRKRRTHWKIAKTTLTPCPQCKAPKVPHCVCKTCGYYRGKQVMEVAIKKEKKKKQ